MTGDTGQRRADDATSIRIRRRITSYIGEIGGRLEESHLFFAGGGSRLEEEFIADYLRLIEDAVSERARTRRGLTERDTKVLRRALAGETYEQIGETGGAKGQKVKRQAVGYTHEKAFRFLLEYVDRHRPEFDERLLGRISEMVNGRGYRKATMIEEILYKLLLGEKARGDGLEERVAEREATVNAQYATLQAELAAVKAQYVKHGEALRDGLKLYADTLEAKLAAVKAQYVKHGEEELAAALRDGLKLYADTLEAKLAAVKAQYARREEDLAEALRAGLQLHEEEFGARLSAVNAQYVKRGEELAKAMRAGLQLHAEKLEAELDIVNAQYANRGAELAKAMRARLQLPADTLEAKLATVNAHYDTRGAELAEAMRARLQELLATTSLTTIEYFGVPRLYVNVLKRKGFEDIEQLKSHTREEISGFSGIGQTGLGIIETALGYLGYAFKGSEPKPFPPGEKLRQSPTGLILQPRAATKLGEYGIKTIGELVANEAQLRSFLGENLYEDVTRIMEFYKTALSTLRPA